MFFFTLLRDTARSPTTLLYCVDHHPSFQHHLSALTVHFCLRVPRNVVTLPLYTCLIFLILICTYLRKVSAGPQGACLLVSNILM